MLFIIIISKERNLEPQPQLIQLLATVLSREGYSCCVRKNAGSPYTRDEKLFI